MKLLKRLPSPAMIVSLLALTVALGGTSYAAGMIGSSDITDNSIRSKDVRDGTLRKTDLAFDPAAGQAATRWVLINAAGEIEAQSGGFSVTAAYPVLTDTSVPPAPNNSMRANANVYINAGEDLTDNGIVATVALQNTLDQDGNSNMNGRAPGPDANAEFSGEISTSICGLAGTACAPPDTGNTNHFVVSPRMSDGSFTNDNTRKRFYVVLTGAATQQ
jgi:hypothetical protein